MSFRIGSVAACMLASTLAACGGGGGSGNSGSVDGTWLTFSPSAATVTQYETESVALSLTATSTRTFSTPVNIAIIDTKGVITTDVSVSQISQLRYVADLRTSATLSAGAHSTILEVRLCEDAPTICKKPLPGSPWQVPLTVQVKSRAEAAARLVLSVPSVSASTYPGEAASFSLEARLNAELAARPANIGLFDPSSMTVLPSAQYLSAENKPYVFKVSTATTNALPVGTHTSNLELRLCQDDISTCRYPVAGSPWIVPLTLTVKSPINLTELKAIDGLGNWSTYQGNAAHTGFVAASFDPTVFSRRWKMPSVASFASNYSSIAVDGGRAFFVRRAANNRWELVAVSEDTGAVAWTVDMGTLASVNPPAAANGRVYLTSTGHGDTFLWVYEQATGAKVKQLTMNSQWPNYSAPTVFGTDVYTISGYYGGMSKYSDQTGSFSWYGSVSPYAGWAPATDGRFAYSFSTPDNTLVALDAANGSRAYAIGEPYPYSTYFTAAPVVLTDTQQAIVVAGNLMAFDLTTHTRSWILSTPATGQAAYGNGTIYVCGPNGRTLEARAPATGNLLWSSPELGASCSEIIVTRNLAFVSSGSGTQAVDLVTNKVVWTHSQGGKLAISARGVLYIFGDSGALAAVNLR
jgi:hypothetical protein